MSQVAQSVAPVSVTRLQSCSTIASLLVGFGEGYKQWAKYTSLLDSYGENNVLVLKLGVVFLF